MVSTNSTIVARPRLIHRLHEAAKYPVVLIIAPAGFGKTTAVRQLLAFCTDPILISVPPGITSLYQFIRAFAQGCSVRFPAMAEPPVEFAANVPLSKYIDLYASWAVAHLKDVESVIAIDDLQNVPAELGIAEFFGRLSDNCKSHLQLILASRTPDNLPLVHWQAYGEATSAISADDLRITVDEATELARAVGSLATEEQLATWVSQTKGFPIPLAFAIRASTTRDRVRDIMDDARSLTFSFLVEQLWKSLTQEERCLLELAAVMPPIHLRDYVNARTPNAIKVLGSLVDRIAFLTMNGDALIVHDLFRDFVKQELTQRSPSSLIDAQRHAAEVLFAAKRHSLGFEMLIESGDLNALYAHVEKYPPALTDFNLISKLIELSVTAAMSSLGIEMLVLHIEFASRTGNAARGLRAAEEILKRRTRTSTQLLCALRAIVRFTQTQSVPQRRQRRDQMIMLISELEERHYALAKAYCAVYMSKLPDSAFAARQLADDVRRSIQDLELQERLEAQNELAVMMFFLGDSRSAVQISREAFEVAKILKNNLSTAQVLNTLGLMLYDLCDSEAETISKILLPLVEKTGAWRFAYISHALPSEYYALQGNSAMSLTASILQHQMILVDAVEIEQALYFRRMCGNLRNLLDEKYASVILDYEASVLPESIGAAYHVFAILSIAYALSGSNADAARTLQNARTEREKLSSAWEQRLVVDIIVAEIVALGIVGKWNQARLLIKDDPLANPAVRSLTRALRLFSEGPPFTGVLNALKQCLGQPYVGLGALLVKRAVSQLVETNTDVTLSPSEREVLCMIGLGKSNKEIATARGRSAETIKRQVASLFKKLGVENRTSAVAIARERGFL